jgi:hypothetical protein
MRSMDLVVQDVVSLPGARAMEPTVNWERQRHIKPPRYSVRRPKYQGDFGARKATMMIRTGY